MERLNQTIEGEFYKVALRKKMYHTINEIQQDLDEFMNYYNDDRTNQGCYYQGRTPQQTYLNGLELYKQYVYENFKGNEAA